MAGEQNGNLHDHTAGGGEADFAQAFKELARGEQTASVLENHLDDLERKIEELLARAEQDNGTDTQAKTNSSNASNSGTSGSKTSSS